MRRGGLLLPTLSYISRTWGENVQTLPLLEGWNIMLKIADLFLQKLHKHDSDVSYWVVAHGTQKNPFPQFKLVYIKAYSA